MDDPKLIAALHAADAAGDAQGAQAIAAHIKALRGATTGGSEGVNVAPVGGSPALPAANAPEGMLNADGSSSFADRVMYGLAGVGVQGYLGAKQMFGKLDSEDEQKFAMSKADVEHSGFAGKAANLAGNVGLGVASSIATPFIAGPAALAKVTPYIKAAIGSGLTAGITTPIEDQSDIVGGKLKEAAKAAVVGPLALGLGEVVKKGATGLFTATKDAINLMRQNINPTLQQAAEGRIGRFVGGLTSGFTDTNKRLEGEVADALTERISAGGVAAPGGTMGERMGMLDAGIATDYANVFGNKKFPMTGAIRDEILRQGDNVGKSGGRFIDQVSETRGILDNIVGSDRNAVRMGSNTLRDNYLNPLQSAISDANDPLVKNALVNAKNVVIDQSRNSRLSPDELLQTGNIDKRYFDLMRMREAAHPNENGVGVGALSKSYENAPGMDRMGATNATNDELIGPLVRTLGKTPRQDEARTALVNAGRFTGALGLGAFTGTAPLLAPLYGISALGQTGVGTKLLTGQTGLQQAFKSALESPQTNEKTLANVLRVLRDNSSNLGAGLTPGQ